MPLSVSRARRRVSTVRFSQFGSAERRIDHAWVVILIQRSAQVENSSVQHQVAIRRSCDRAHAKRRRQRIDDRRLMTDDRQILIGGGLWSVVSRRLIGKRGFELV